MNLANQKTILRLCARANGAYTKRRFIRFTRFTSPRSRQRQCGFVYRPALRLLRPDVAARLDRQATPSALGETTAEPTLFNQRDPPALAERLLRLLDERAELGGKR